jgi:hypothetical protein
VTENDADGNIKAYNSITGKTYDGPAADLMKKATAKEDQAA